MEGNLLTVIKTTNPRVFELEAAKQLRDGEDGLIVCVNQSVCVWSGVLPLYRRSFCAAHNIPVAAGEYIGGCIVCMPGDLSLIRTAWGSSDFATDLARRAAEMLVARGLSVSIDGNDVLVDGCKVISWASSMAQNGWSQNVIHFSIGPMDMELVRHVCAKPMMKTPGSLGVYGITAEMLLTELIGTEVTQDGV